MEKLFRSLGMTDKDGKVFGVEEIRRQVMSSLGVSEPSMETVDIPGPPFDSFADCCEACLALPAPGDEEFEDMPEAARVLAVAAAFAQEITEGTWAFLENTEDAYADRTADSLRAVGMPEMAEAFGADLAAYRASEGKPALHRYAEVPLREAVLAYANGHPEVFGAPAGSEA
ncbi:MAG: hypothetical protein IJK28_01125 [Clostridia bacterium]|nr:hypothetical protein [Clostridia bacterium]